MLLNDIDSIKGLLDKINSEYPTTLKLTDVTDFVRKLYPTRRIISDWIIAIIIFHLLRENNEARSFREFSTLTGMDLRHLTKYYKLFIAENKIEQRLPTLESFIKRYSAKLNLPIEIEEAAFDYLEKLKATEEYNVFNAHQCSSALVVLACCSKNHTILKRDMINATNLTQPTIKLYCKRVSKALGIEYRDILVGQEEKRPYRINIVKSIRVEKCRV